MKNLLILITGICIGLALAGRADVIRDGIELVMSYFGFVPEGAI